MKGLAFILASLGMVMNMAEGQSTADTPLFGNDLAFLKLHTEVVLLSDSTGSAQVVVVPAYQGRVMTSSSKGSAGISYGWVNRALIASGTTQPHINVFGGEDRFWIGPEGGQFSVFFSGGDPFDLDHWHTPAPIDTEPFEVADRSADRARFFRTFRLTNYSGARFDLRVDREIRLLKPTEMSDRLGAPLGHLVSAVAFESVNSVTNTGKTSWSKDTGMLSIWILGMFNASPSTTVVVPYQKGPEATLGPVVNDSYFGKVPSGRLAVGDGVLFFAADAKHRSKIGVSPRRATSTLGSYDAQNHVLTLVQFTFPRGTQDYVNSMWEIQEDPFGGDVVNSYNDGPATPGGSQLGRFYELETSSPALALGPAGTARHVHRTFHLEGPEKELDRIARATLGVGISRIAAGLSGERK
jgi:hypothetical protein